MIKGFKQYNEQAVKPVVFTFGRFNPPTIGHLKLLDKIASLAKGNNYRVYPSQSTDPKKNPLQYKEKVQFMRKMFPKHGRNIVMDPKIKTVFNIADQLYKEGFNQLIMVVGADRTSEFEKTLKRYNGQKRRDGYYNFIEGIKVISAGRRDPDSEGVEGMSASKMRTAAIDGDFNSFQTGLPKGYSDGTKLFNTLRKRMGLREITNFREHIQLNTVSEKRELYSRGEIFNIGDEVLCKEGNTIIIKERKPNFIVDVDGNKHWISDLTEKLRKRPEDKDIGKMKGRQPKTYYTGLGKGTKAKRAAQFKKQAKMKDDDPDAYKPAPGDKSSKTKPSKHTTKFKKMFGEEDNPRIPRKKGQPAGSDKHSDLYTDENPKGTIKGLGFKDVATAEASIKKIENSGKTHAHKIQAAIAMEQRAKVMGKKGPAAVYRTYINKMKKITKKRNEDVKSFREMYGTDAGFNLDKDDGYQKSTDSRKEVTPGEEAGVEHYFPEKLDPRKHDAGDYIKDFMKSDAPQFKGKTKEEIKKMAIAAYLQAKDDAGIKEKSPGLWANIHKRRKSGKRMRKPGEKGAPTKKAFKSASESVEEKTGKKSEPWPKQYERRVVKTTKPEHKKKGYNWRIKGKERSEISIKLYKTKPSYKEFTKQMKRVAGHEFGG